jgi:hypothetical protein
LLAFCFWLDVEVYCSFGLKAVYRFYPSKNPARSRIPVNPLIGHDFSSDTASCQAGFSEPGGKICPASLAVQFCL